MFSRDVYRVYIDIHAVNRCYYDITRRHFNFIYGMWSSIAKFGGKHCDLPTMLWNLSVLLRVLTLNIDRRHTKRPSAFVYLFCLVTILCYFYVYLVSMIWFVSWKLSTGEIIDAMIILALGFSSEIGIAKTFFMFLNKEAVNILFDGYLACDILVEPDSRFSRNILEILKHVKKRAIFFWMVVIGNGIVYCTKPALLPGRHIMEDRFIYLGLQPMYETPNYQIAFAITVAACFQTCYTAANITSLFIVTVGYTEAQMLALSEELNCLWTDANKYTEQLNINSLQRDEELHEFVKEKLSYIIQRHTVNISLLQQVETVFRGMNAVEFLFLIISLIAELLGGLENTYILVPFAMIQVTMDCWTGQRLLDASLVFERAVYNSNWENFNESNMKTVLIMLIVSQKEMVLSAGGITMLNFQSLMAVIKSVYSAYTTLSTTM